MVPGTQVTAEHLASVRLKAVRKVVSIPRTEDMRANSASADRTPNDASASRGASANLDLLRSMAVLMVLFDHICRHYHLDRLGRFAVADIGIFGVLLFFVHTSLVLMYSMQRSGLLGLALMKNFYLRRFFRIYPLSVLTVFAAVALHLHANGRGIDFGPRPGSLELISNLLLVQNLTYSASIVGPLWTLPLEVQMYLLLPFLFLWRKRSFWWLLVLWIVCGLLGHYPQVVPNLGWFTLLLYIPNFLPGVMAFTLPHKPLIPAYWWPPFVVSLALAFALIPGRASGGVLCLLLGVAIPLFKEETFRPLRFVSNKIATYSYGIYLGHSFCVWFALTIFQSWTLLLITIVLLPMALYHGLESPAIQLGTRFADRVSKPRLTAAPAAAQL
jgi:peptidoglycan/LPS O-acetylase OafA/YrhL